MKFLVHVCFNPETEERPEFCGCRYWIGQNVLVARIKKGELVRLSEDERFPHVARQRNAVLKRAPRAATIERAHMERAYGIGGESGNWYEQKRIELFAPVRSQEKS